LTRQCYQESLSFAHPLLRPSAALLANLSWNKAASPGFCDLENVAHEVQLSCHE